MSAPTPAPGDDRPREGYYPDPSIPGYVRYWNGASWVPGTSRPAPRDGEPLPPPPGARPAPPAVEETGPHFFDEDPPDVPRQGGPGEQWVQAGRGAQWGEPGVPGQAGPAGPGGPAAGAQHGRPGRTGPAGQMAQGAQGAQWSQPAQAGRPGLPGQSGGPAQWGGPGRSGDAPPAGSAADAGPAGARGADPRTPADSPGGPDGRATARTDGTATIPPAEGEAPDPGTFVFRRPIPGPAAARGDDGAPAFGPAPSGAPGTPGAPAPAPAPESGSPGFGAQGPVGAPGGSGFGAGKAAAARAAGGQAPVPAGAVPQQALPGQAAAPGTPLTSGPGGGQASWAQQVHRLAGGGDEPVVPWKPPVEDLFQAAARRQAAARPAGLGKRFTARLIDLLAMGAVTSAAAVPLGVRAVDHVQQKIDAARLSGREVTVWLLDGTTGTSLGIVVAVLLLTGVLYEVLPTVKWGRTAGKKLCGLEVRDIEAHEPPTFGPALRRWLVLSVPGLLVVGVVGVLWCLFDRPWRQGWHDKAAHTFVAG